MNWLNWLKYIGPIFAAILAAITANNAAGIQDGVYAADAGNWGMTAFTGLGSLLSLVAGMVAQWRATGKLPIATAAEIVALQTLAATLAADGDTPGLELLSPLARHIVQKKGKPLPDLAKGLDFEQLVDAVLKRLKT